MQKGIGNPTVEVEIVAKIKISRVLIFILVGALETVNFWAGLYPSTYNFVVVEQKYFDGALLEQ